jgi:hypothetical protein
LRHVDESALHVKDSFDSVWAEDSLDTATEVFDLVWLAVLLFHQRAIPAVAEQGLNVKYPLVGILLRRDR